MPGSILDVIGNPFAATNGSGSGTQASDLSYFPPAPSAPSQGMPTSQLPPSPIQSAAAGYSPLRDPEGPLARAGWIGALMANGPSRTEYLSSLEDQQKRQVGVTRAKAFKILGTYVQEGNSPQQAFLKFLQSPEGTDFVVTDPDPQGAISDFMKMAQPDPVAAARASVFGGNPSPTAGPPTQGQPQGGNSAIAPGPNGTVMPANPLAGTNAEQLRQGAQRLMAVGDKEGADLAVKLAEQYDTLAKEPTTDELKEYQKTVEQEKAAGREPPSWFDYKLKMVTAGSNKPDYTTQARVEVDKDGAKAAAEVAQAAGSALPILKQIADLSNKTPGGYYGASLPYLTRIATSFGIEVPQEWDDAQVLQALSQRLLPLVRQPGQVSNYEQQTYMNALPGLIQTAPGRAKLIVALSKQAERAQQIARIWRDNLGAPDLYDKLDAVYKQDMFTPDELKAFEEAAKMASKPVQGPPDPGAQFTPKSATGSMPSGSVVTDSRGVQWKYNGTGDYHDQKNYTRVEGK